MKNLGKDLQDIFGKNVKNNRKRLKYTLETLAEKVNVSRNTISSIERGIRFAKAETIAKLAVVFRIPVSELFRTKDVLPASPESILFQFGEDIKEAMDNVINDYNKKLGR